MAVCRTDFSAVGPAEGMRFPGSLSPCSDGTLQSSVWIQYTTWPAVSTAPDANVAPATTKHMGSPESHTTEYTKTTDEGRERPGNPNNQPATANKATFEEQYPPYGNGMFPFPQPPWLFPQQVPPGYGRPPVSNEEGGNPYFGYFGYHGFGGRHPYYSEEMYEQDYEQPKEEDPPKVESTTSAPPPNTTALENNSTQPTVPSPGGSQGGNETSPTGNDAQAQNPGNNQGVHPGVHSTPSVNISIHDVLGSQIPQVPSQSNIFENSPDPNFGGFPSQQP
ncbi:enamelin [Vombatus ursinus]|uniref:enamelin n=1 Tax=Vombatus ursinus TaxID=29139 RepID=UPI000FFD0CF8|nr:enamelin [Vombatus ursinus]